jgi:hypothetical protein
MMTQFRTQSDQMTSQFNHLAVQLGTEASTPRPLTPSTTLQPPPGIDQQPETVVSEDSVHEPDNPSWLHGPPLVTQTQDSRSPSYLPPVVGSRSIQYAPVNITPGTAPVPPAASTLAPSTLPPHHHSSDRTPPRSLFSLGGSQSGRGNGAQYGPRRTEEYLSGYYWEQGMSQVSLITVPWLELSLQGPYDGKSEKFQKAPLSLADDSLTGFIQFYNVLRANLHSSGYNMHLLPDLPSICANTDLAISPVLASDLPSIGYDRSEYCPVLILLP